MHTTPQWYSAWDPIFFPSKSKYCMNTPITEGISLNDRSSISRQMVWTSSEIWFALASKSTVHMSCRLVSTTDATSTDALIAMYWLDSFVEDTVCCEMAENSVESCFSDLVLRISSRIELGDNTDSFWTIYFMSCSNHLYFFFILLGVVRDRVLRCHGQQFIDYIGLGHPRIKLNDRKMSGNRAHTFHSSCLKKQNSRKHLWHSRLLLHFAESQWALRFSCRSITLGESLGSLVRDGEQWYLRF